MEKQKLYCHVATLDHETKEEKEARVIPLPSSHYELLSDTLDLLAQPVKELYNVTIQETEGIIHIVGDTFRIVISKETPL